jgi:hypothetical protein
MLNWLGWVRSAVRRESLVRSRKRRRTLLNRAELGRVSRTPAHVEVLENRQLLSNIVVTSTADNGAGSLRLAIFNASPGSTIVFDPSLANKTIQLTSGHILILNSVKIVGETASGLTINGGGSDRIFSVTRPGPDVPTVMISGLTLQNGNAKNANGALPGGAINNNGGIVTLANDTFTGNSGSVGGAIFNNSGSTLTVVNSTFFANTATSTSSGGGAIYNFNSNPGSLTITNDTIVGNTAAAADSGGGVYSGKGTVISPSNNDLLVGNTAAGVANDVSGFSFAAGTKYVTGANPAGTTVSNIFNTSAPVLQNNGGPTATLALVDTGTDAAIGTGATLTAPTLSATLVSSATNNQTVSVSSTTDLAAGELVQIDSETLVITSIDSGAISVLGGQLSTAAATHGAGALIRVLDQRGVLPNPAPDIGAFQTRSATFSIAVSAVYTGAAVSAPVTARDASNNSVLSGAASFLSYVYYAGTLTAAQISSATPLSGAPRNVGDYTVVASLSAYPGYPNAVSGPLVYSITPATLTITAASHSRAYDGTTSAGATPGVSGLLGSDTVTGLSEAFASKDVKGANGSTLTVTGYVINDGNGGKDYTVTTVTNTGTITAAALTITAGSDSKTYDGTTSSGATPTVGTLYGTDTVTGLSQAFGVKDVLGAGKSTLSVTGYTVNDGNGGADYKVTTATNTGTITAAALTITAASDSKTYDGTTSSSATPTFGTLYSTDSVTGLSQAFGVKDVLGAGKSTLSVTNYTVNDGNGGADYTVTTKTNTGTITPAALTICAATDSKVYDGTTNSGGTPTVAGTLYNSDTITGVTQAFASKDVLGKNGSTLAITGYTVNDGNGGKDYTVTTKTKAGTITPVGLTITAAGDSKTYDGTTGSSAAPSVGTLYSTDTVTGLSQVFASKDVLGKAGSTLSVTGYTVNDGNGGKDYTVTTKTGTGTITPAALTITAGSDSKTYDGTTSSSGTPTVGTVLGSDSVTGLTQSFLSKDVLGANGSTLTITGYTVNDGNGGNDYTVTTKTSTGTITPAALTISAVYNTKVSDGTVSAAAVPIVTAGSLLGTDSFSTLSESYASSAITATNGATLNVSYAINDGNGGKDYAVTTVSHAGTITGAAFKLAYLQGPANTTAGVAMSPAVKVAVEDNKGTVVDSLNSSAVTMTLSAGTFDSKTNGGANNVTANVSNGVATFNGSGLDLDIDLAGKYALKATDGALIAVTSAQFTIAAAAPSQLVLQQNPTTGTAGAALSPAIKVAVEDQFNNLVLTTNTVTLTLDTGSFSNGKNTVTANTVNGVATFATATINTVGSYNITPSMGAFSTPSFGVTISPNVANKLVYQTAPPTTGVAGVALNPTIVVAVEDAFGNLVDDSSQVALSLNINSFASGATVNAVHGLATFTNATITTAGSYKVTASDGSLKSVTSGPLTVVKASDPCQIVIQSSPTTGTAGVALSPTIKVAVEDFYNNLVLPANTVTLTLSSGVFSNGKNTITANTAGGIATFSNIIINTAGALTVTASVTALPLVPSQSFAVTISPNSASKVAYVQAPTNGTAGLALSPTVVAAVEDKFGNVVTSDNSSTVTLTISAGTFGPLTNGGANTVTAAVSGGLATFSGVGLDLYINKVGNYTLKATDGALTAVTSPTFTISAAAAATMTFTTVPVSATAGATMGAVKVTLKDAFGNVATSDSSKVTIAVATGPSSSFKSGTLTVAASNGVATFSDLVLTTSGKFTLSASDGSLSLVAPSSAITINPAAASQLSFSVQPVDGTHGVGLSSSVKVSVLDQYGNLVTAPNITVTLSLSNSGLFVVGAANPITVSAMTAGGVATFAGLKIKNAGTYTLQATSGALTLATSNSFVIS